MTVNEIYTMYKLGGFWSSIGKAVGNVGRGIAGGVKSFGHTIGDVLTPRNVGIAAATATGLAGAAALGHSLANGAGQKQQAIQIIQGLINQVADPQVQQRLQDIISGLQDGSIDVNTVVQILEEGGLM